MKKVWFTMIIGALVLESYAQAGYKITGNIANMPDGTVWLLARTNMEKLDTLGNAMLKSGKFELTGQVKSNCLALLVMPDMKTGFQLMLENTDFTLIGDMQEKVTVTGGRAQNLFDQFGKIDKEMAATRQSVEQAARSVQTNAQMMSLQNRYDAAVKKTTEQRLELIRTNGDCFVSAYMLSGVMQNLSLEDLRGLYEGFSSEVKDGLYGKLIAKQIVSMEKVAVGAVCSDFTVMTPEGQPISLSSIKGKVKVIDFWASWCPPCRNENPQVVRMYEKYHPKGLEIFGVSLDTDKAAWLQAIDEDKLPWPQGSELLQVPQVAIIFGIKSIPHTILLDENNKIIAKDLRGKDLEKKIIELLEE